MKNLLNLEGVLQLNKEQLQKINGGKAQRCENQNCPPGYCCGSNLYSCVLAGPNNSNCK